MTHERGGGPYRESVDPKAEALERMRKKIETEGKYGILIAENIKSGDNIPFLDQAIANKVNPEDIILYSVAKGRLELVFEFPASKTNERQLCYAPLDYTGPNPRVTVATISIKKGRSAWKDD